MVTLCVLLVNGPVGLFHSHKASQEGKLAVSFPSKYIPGLYNQMLESLRVHVFDSGRCPLQALPLAALSLSLSSYPSKHKYRSYHVDDADRSSPRLQLAAEATGLTRRRQLLHLWETNSGRHDKPNQEVSDLRFGTESRENPCMRATQSFCMAPNHQSIPTAASSVCQCSSSGRRPWFLLEQ